MKKILPMTFHKVFPPGLRLMDKNANPVYCKVCPIPYILRNKIDKELVRLVGEDISLHGPLCRHCPCLEV